MFVGLPFVSFNLSSHFVQEMQKECLQSSPSPYDVYYPYLQWVYPHLVYSRQIVQSAEPFTKCVSQQNIWNMQTDSHDMQGQKIETQLLFRILWSYTSSEALN